MNVTQTGITLVSFSPFIVKLDNGTFWEMLRPEESALQFTAQRIIVEQAQREAIIAQSIELFKKSDGTMRDSKGAVRAHFTPSRKLGSLIVANVRGC